MKTINNNYQNEEALNKESVLDSQITMVHKSLKKFPDILTINNVEEIPYYSAILGDEYNLSFSNRVEGVEVKKN